MRYDISVPKTQTNRKEEHPMSSTKSNHVFNKLYANRITVTRNGSVIINLSLIFALIAFLTAPWLVIGGAIAALALGYKFGYARNAADFVSDFDTVVQDAKNNVRTVVDAVTNQNDQQ